MADERQPHLRPFRPAPLPPMEHGAMASEEHHRLQREGIDPPPEHFVDDAPPPYEDTPDVATYNNGNRARKRKHEDEDEEALLRTVNMGEVAMRPVEWLWHPWMAYGKLAVLDGDPSLGKSTLALTFAACVSNGLRFPNEDAPIQAREPQHVVVLSAEDGAGDTIKPRLIEAGARLENITLVQSVGYDEDRQRMVHLPEDVPLLRELVGDLHAGLVVMDVLAAYTGGRGMNSHADADIRTVLAPLSQMADDTRAAVLALRHLNKTSSETNAMYRGGGSIAIVGAARHAFVVAQHPEDEDKRIMACVKNNLAKKPEPFAYSIVRGEKHDVARAVFHSEPVDVSLDQMMRGKKEQRQYAQAPTKKAAAMDLVATMLEDGPLPATDIQATGKELFGLTPRTMQRAAEELGIVPYREELDNGTHRWMWHLPGEDE